MRKEGLLIGFLHSMYNILKIGREEALGPTLALVNWRLIKHQINFHVAMDMDIYKLQHPTP